MINEQIGIDNIDNTAYNDYNVTNENIGDLNNANEFKNAEDEMMDEIIREMGLDSQSILAQKYNVNSGKLVMKTKMSELKSNGMSKHIQSAQINT